MFSTITKIANQIASLPGNIIQTLRNGYNKMYPTEDNNIPPPELKELIEELDKKKEPIKNQEESEEELERNQKRKKRKKKRKKK